MHKGGRPKDNIWQFFTEITKPKDGKKMRNTKIVQLYMYFHIVRVGLRLIMRSAKVHLKELNENIRH